MSDAELLVVFDALPDLLEQAHRTRDGRDVYEVLGELEAEHQAAARAYVRSMPYRSPPSPCSTREHSIPHVEHRVIAPALHEDVTLSARTLHEAREHGGELPEALRALLRRLSMP